MVVFRCTSRVLAQVKEPPAMDPPSSTTRLGDWYTNLLYLRPARLLLCVAERTLLPILVPAKDFASFTQRMSQALREVLVRLEVEEGRISDELDAMSKFTFSKTASRRVLGSMNDFARMLEIGYENSELSLIEKSLHLAQAPCGPLGMESPDGATRALFAGKPTLRLL